jgi:hypothetical protein
MSDDEGAGCMVRSERSCGCPGDYCLCSRESPE